eukprot:7188315-Pyramimonas_sp.AAC.1
MAANEMSRKQQMNRKAFQMSKSVTGNVFHTDIFEGLDSLRRQLLRGPDRASVKFWYDNITHVMRESGASWLPTVLVFARMAP